MFPGQTNFIIPKLLQPHSFPQLSMPSPPPNHTPLPPHSPATYTTQLLALRPTTHKYVSCPQFHGHLPPHPVYTTEWGGRGAFSPTLHLSHTSMPLTYDPPPPYQPPNTTSHPPITSSLHHSHLPRTPHPWPWRLTRYAATGVRFRERAEGGGSVVRNCEMGKE